MGRKSRKAKCTEYKRIKNQHFCIAQVSLTGNKIPLSQKWFQENCQKEDFRGCIFYDNDCFITKACAVAHGLGDDCHELQVLRGVRDIWLLQQPFGKAVVETYYNIAPKIIAGIDNEIDADAIYNWLYRSYIVPCVNLAEAGKQKDCYDLYNEMVNRLMLRYL